MREETERGRERESERDGPVLMHSLFGLFVDRQQSVGP